MLFDGLREAHELRTTRCLIQTQNVESLDSRPLRAPVANGAKRCRNKFLRYFPQGADQKYIDWERGYKWTAHQRWQEILGQEEHRALIRRDNRSCGSKAPMSILGKQRASRMRKKKAPLPRSAFSFIKCG
jgi:hypothetical protein